MGKEKQPTDVLFGLTLGQAKRVAGVAACASKDQERPVICAMQLTWEPAEGGGLQIEAVATDSYVMGWRKFTLTDGYEAAPGTGSILVEAKPFAKALIDAAKAPGSKPRVVVTFNDDGMLVTNVAQTVTFNVNVVDGGYPKWRKLWVGVDRVDFGQMHGETPYINPDKFRQIHDGAGKFTKAERDKLTPFRLEFGDHRSAQLAPFAIRLTETDYGSYRGLQMPVRV